MRCYIIPIAVHRLTKLRRTGRTPVFPLLQFFDPTSWKSRVYAPRFPG
jgi:hypothetical protein